MYVCMYVYMCVSLIPTLISTLISTYKYTYTFNETFISFLLSLLLLLIINFFLPIQNSFSVSSGCMFYFDCVLCVLIDKKERDMNSQVYFFYEKKHV